MKKIIALAVVGMFVSACDFDLREDEQDASRAIYALVTGRGIDIDTTQGGAVDGPFLGTEAAGVWTIDGVTPSRAGYGRVLVVTFDGLLDGASIEETPQTCLAAGDWLTVTTTATLPAGGVWYTCYYPSSSTNDDGSSVFIYYSTTPPGTTTAAQPIRAGTMTAGDYTFTGEIRSSSGAALAIDVEVTVI